MPTVPVCSTWIPFLFLASDSSFLPMQTPRSRSNSSRDGLLQLACARIEFSDLDFGPSFRPQLNQHRQVSASQINLYR